MRYLLVLFVLLVAGRPSPAAGLLDSLRVLTPQPVLQYAKLELALSLSASFANPYDPDQIAVDVEFTAPDGRTRRVPGFYYQDFQIDDCQLVANAPGYWLPQPTPLPWRIRFTPDMAGTWLYRLRVQVAGQPQWLPHVYSVVCTASTLPGFVRVAPNQRYLQFANGASYFALGENVDYWGVRPLKNPFYQGPRPDYSKAPWCEPYRPTRPNRPKASYQASLMQPCEDRQCFSTYVFEAHRRTFQELGDNGGNFARLWLQDFNWDFDGDSVGYYESRQNRLYDFDRMLEEAHRYHIKLHLVLLDGIRLWEENGFANWPSFAYARQLHLAHPVDFFTHPEARRLFRNHLRYLAARWGYSPTLLSYELINEGDFISGGKFLAVPANRQALQAWVVEMSNYLRSLDPNHLQTIAFGPENSDALLEAHPELFDFTKSHFYSNSYHADVQRNYLAQRQVQRHHKPYQLQETDYLALGCGVNVDAQAKFHTFRWATSFGGAFGAALPLCHDCEIHNPCWPSYSDYKPLSRFLRLAGFQSTALNTAVGNSRAAAHSFYRTADLTTINLMAPTSPFGSPCDLQLPEKDWGWVFVGMSAGPGPDLHNPNLLAAGITTSHDTVVEVYALQSPGKVLGWVHNKTHYWYNLPHSSNCDCAHNPALAGTATTLLSIPDATMTVGNLQPGSRYNVQWFYPHPGRDVDANGDPNDGGFLSDQQTVATADFAGRITLGIPPLTALSLAPAPTAPDYGFVVTLLE